MPTTQEIARQITMLVEISPLSTTSEIAQMLAYPPLFTINGIAAAVQAGYITQDRKKDMLTLSMNKLDYTQGAIFGETDARVREEIMQAVERANSKQDDQSVDQLKLWALGVPSSAIDMALHALAKMGAVVRYTLEDPQDPESKYEFITLPDNKGKDWGYKQFKTLEKKKKK